MEIPTLPPRRPDSHKGDYGRVLVVGGSRCLAGAPALTALAALRSGAGLVTAAIPDCATAPIAALAPEAMTLPIPSRDGHFTAAEFSKVFDPSRYDVMAVGPGMGQSDDAAFVVQEVLIRFDGVIVLDADALNVLPRLRLPEGKALIATPHPGEAARLLGCSIEEVNADRMASARALVKATGAVCVLKGHETIVAPLDPAAEAYVCHAGNPGMASGGSGDVLTGVVAALAAQRMSPFSAAVAGVFVHATAGDFAAQEVGLVPLIARDIISALPLAFKELCRQ